MGRGSAVRQCNPHLVATRIEFTSVKSELGVARPFDSPCWSSPFNFLVLSSWRSSWIHPHLVDTDGRFVATGVVVGNTRWQGNEKKIQFFPSKTCIVDEFWYFCSHYRVANFLAKLVNMLLFSTEKTKFPFFGFPYFRVLPVVVSWCLRLGKFSFFCGGGHKWCGLHLCGWNRF